MTGQCRMTGLLFWLALTGPGAWAQVARPVTVEGHVDYDTFFGAYPSVSVSRPIDSLHTLTGYGVFYTNPSFFGAETGVTISFTTPRRHWTITPGAGLVSGSVFVEGRSFTIGEGYFGSLGVQYEPAGWYVQGYGAYWSVLKRRTADAYDFAFYFVQVGRVFSSAFRVGLVFGQLANVRLPRNNGDATEFDAVRFGIATTTSLPFGLTGQLGGGLATGTGPTTFLQVGLSRPLTHWRNATHQPNLM